MARISGEEHETIATLVTVNAAEYGAHRAFADLNRQEDHAMVTAKKEPLSRLLALYCMPMLELRESADGRRFIAVRKHDERQQKDWNVVAAWLNEELSTGFVEGVPVKGAKKNKDAALHRLVSAVEAVLADSAGGEMVAMPVAGEHGKLTELH